MQPVSEVPPDSAVVTYNSRTTRPRYGPPAAPGSFVDGQARRSLCRQWAISGVRARRTVCPRFCKAPTRALSQVSVGVPGMAAPAPSPTRNSISRPFSGPPCRLVERPGKWESQHQHSDRCPDGDGGGTGECRRCGVAGLGGGLPRTAHCGRPWLFAWNLSAVGRERVGGGRGSPSWHHTRSPRRAPRYPPTH